MDARVLLFLIATAQAQPAVPPRDLPSTATGSAAISGQITDQQSKQPIPRAIVKLISSTGEPERETTADAEGKYELTKIPAGEYGLVAGPGELRASHLVQALGRAEPLDGPRMPPRYGVELKDGERRNGLDLALTKALAIEGRVLDPWGEPMANVPITIFRAGDRPYRVSMIHTDDRGEYRAWGLAPGRYHACANAQQSSDTVTEIARLVRSCHPGVTNTAEAADVVVANADVAGIDITMQRTGTFSVSGSMTTAAGAIVDAPRVSAFSADPDGVTKYAEGSNGRFVLRGLTPGRYILRGWIDDPAKAAEPYRGQSRELEVGHTTIDVTGGDVADCTISLSRGRTVSGAISFEGGPPVPPSRLRLTVQAVELGIVAMRMIRDAPPTAVVSDTLTFELSPLYDRPVTFLVTGLPPQWVVRSVRSNGHEVANVPTIFAADRARLDITVTNRTAEPSIRVTDDQGTAVQSFTTVLLPADPRQQTMWQGRAPGPPSRDGVVKISPILPGDYLVAAIDVTDAFLLATDPARLADLASVATRVTFAEGDRRTVELRLTSLPARKR